MYGDRHLVHDEDERHCRQLSGRHNSNFMYDYFKEIRACAEDAIEADTSRDRG